MLSLPGQMRVGIVDHQEEGLVLRSRLKEFDAEVARNVQENVRYAVERALGMPVARVNVRVQGLRMHDKP